MNLELRKRAWWNLRRIVLDLHGFNDVYANQYNIVIINVMYDDLDTSVRSLLQTYVEHWLNLIIKRINRSLIGLLDMLTMWKKFADKNNTSVLNSCISHKTQVVSHQQVMKFELLVTNYLANFANFGLLYTKIYNILKYVKSRSIKHTKRAQSFSIYIWTNRWALLRQPCTPFMSTESPHKSFNAISSPFQI